MPKFYITFLIFFLCPVFLISQSRKYTLLKSEENPFHQLAVPAGMVDTLHYFTLPSALYIATDGGYVGGTNIYGDLGKYQRFDFADSITALIGFVTLFGEKGVVGEADNINFVVKDLSTGGSPGTTQFSKVITTEDIDTTTFTSVSLNPFLSDPGSLFIGFEWESATDDSFGIVSDSDGGGDGANRAWEKWSDGQYSSFNGGDDTWGLDIDLWIAAIVETTTGVEIISPSGFNLSQNYPNPFNPSTKIRFTLGTPSKVIIKVYNILGEEITTLIDKDFSAGSHFVNFDASNLYDSKQVLNSGVYLYKLKSEGYDGAINSEVKKMILMR